MNQLIQDNNIKLSCLNNIKKMDSDSQGSQRKQSDEQFTGSVKKSAKQPSKSKEKKGGKGKGGKKQPKQKQKKEAKEPKKKKPSKSKDKGANLQKDTETVKQYLEKQNRPYNLLNIFDNLHGSIKKPSLEQILDGLTQSGSLTCKQFGKNKVYFLNQAKFQINDSQIEKISVDLTEAREQNSQLQERHKQLLDQSRKLMALKTQTQLKNQIQKLKFEITKLETKKQRLMGQGNTKIDEHIVIQIQKEQDKLRKDLKKYRGIKKEALATWSQILQKKTHEVAEMMGVDV